MLAGTPGFQPPEQLRSEALGIAADVYAFGGVLVVLFGEKTLWPGHSPYQILCKVTVMGKQPPVDHLPMSIQVLCLKALASVEKRPCIQEVLSALISIAKKDL